MTSETLLFSKSLVPEKFQEALPKGLVFRPLERSDWHHGHLDVLRGLTHVGEISEDRWIERFDWMIKCNGTYFVLVIVDENRDAKNKIVGTGTLIVEKKFLYNLGIQGHIEDIAIAEDQQGKRLGIKLIEALDHIAAETGCYKTILDCSPEKAGFYKKCGYEQKGLEMHHYYDSGAEKHNV